jgi:DNA-binding IscR family transcriptional regulator
MNRKHLALHVLFHLAQAQLDGRRVNIEDLVSALRVRRSDIRSILTSLHQQDLYDVLRGNLTLAGFAVAVRLSAAKLPELRPAKPAAVSAA